MNWPGMKHQHAVARWGGSVDWDDPTQIPNGVGVIVKNNRFRAESPATRYGRKHTMTYAASGGVTGLDCLNVLVNNPQQIPILFTDTGLLLRETPPGSGTLVPVNPPLILPTHAYMQDALAFNRMYMAISDGQTGLLPPIVLDGPSGITSVVGQNPTGALWAQNTLYQVGDLVRALDGRWWRCTVASTGVSTAIPPQWPQFNGYFNARLISTIASPGSFIPLAVVTLDSTAGLVAGGTVAIVGNSNPLFNGSWPIVAVSSPTSLTITFTALSATQNGSGGSINNNFVPATAADPAGGSQWEEWTPATTQYIGAPDVSGAAVTNNPGGGTIPSGKDVYIKLSYVIPQSGEGPRSIANVFVNTGTNDQITITFQAGATGTTAGPNMLRSLAEINLKSVFYYPLFMNVWIASVATGAAAPADSAYQMYALQQSVGAPVVVSSLSSAPSIGQVVSSVTVTNGGLFTGPPTVTASGGGGSGTIFRTTYRIITILHPSISIQFVLTGVTVVNGGQGYTTAPTLTFSPAGSGAAATANLGSTVGLPAGQFYLQGCSPVPIAFASPPPFIGEGGLRYMAVLRQNLNGSLSPVDPDSPIPINLVGEVQIPIVTITRDTSGHVHATVGDITGFAPGQDVTVGGCTTDTTFNGIFTLTGVQATLSPQGILSWTDGSHLSNSNDYTGSVIIPPGPAPTAFLPPPGSNGQQNIAAYTVAAPQDGQPIQLQEGPFTYIPSAFPPKPFQSNIVSMQGPLTLNLVITSLQRFVGGLVNCVVPNINGITPGMFAIVQNQGDASFNGTFVINSIIPGTGPTGTLIWQQDINAATGGPGGGGLPLIIQSAALGQVQAVLQDASGLASGDVVNIQGASPAVFNGPVTLASVLGNVITFPSAATGTATLSAGLAILLQDLPTTSSAQSATIGSIVRDFSGNVTLQVPSLGGWAPGQVVNVAGVLDPSFNGLFRLVAATLNNDGVSGTLCWIQFPVGQSQSSGGTISSANDFAVNFDDNALSNGADVTAQLTAAPPPVSADVYFSETLNRVIYTKGSDTQHYFSNIEDAENVNTSGGILAVAASNGAKTVCVREMENGEIISMKQNAGYAILQNSLTPDQWDVVRRWKDHGPVSARAVDVGPDFLIIFVEYTGPYRYSKGELTWIGQEKQGTWDRVNWAAKNTISVAIDDDNKTVHFSLPLDGATTPNKDVSVNYFNGWQDPLILNMMGQVIPNRYGRRWDEADLTAFSMKVVKRSITLDNRVNDKQLLFGRSDQGVGKVFVDTFQPDVYSDDGNTALVGGGWNQLGIDWQYQPAYDQSPTCDVLRIAKCKGQLLGAGSINFQAITNDPSVVVDPVLFIPSQDDFAEDFSLGLRLGEDSPVVGLNINNGKQPGAFAQLHKLIIGGNEEYPSERTL